MSTAAVSRLRPGRHRRRRNTYSPCPGWTAGSLAHCHLEDSFVAVVGNAVLVAPAAGGQPQVAVDRGFDGPQPAVGADEVLLDVGERAPGDHRTVDARAPQAGDVEHVADDRDAAAGRRRDRVRPDRRHQAGPGTLAGGALARGPSVIAALHHEVRLVHDVVAELLLPEPSLRVERQTLRVAVPVAPDIAAGERVV